MHFPHRREPQVGWSKKKVLARAKTSELPGNQESLYNQALPSPSMERDLLIILTILNYLSIIPDTFHEW